MKKLEGIIIPCVTPFQEDGALAVDDLRFNYEKWNATRVQGYMALGSNGEFRSLDDDEALCVLKTASETASKEKLFIGGIGRESLVHTLRFLDRVTEAGLQMDYVSVLTPHYFKGRMTDAALAAYFTAVADRSEYPVLLYCAPSFANGVCISPGLLKELADHPNIYGIKDTSKDMMNTYMDTVGGREDFEVFSGSLGTIMTCFERGGKGGIVSAANYFPNACAKLYEIFCAEGLEAARVYHAEVKELSGVTGARASVAGVKTCMNIMGYRAGVPRVPVLPCDAEQAASFREEIEKRRDLLADDFV